MNDYIIETHNLTKKYGNQTSVSQLNIHVKKGRIYGLLGRNGAGKTTTMRMLVGLTAPTSGEAVVLGMPFKGNEKKILPHIGSLIESPGFYPNLTGTENLKIFAELRGLKNPNCIKGALELVNLPYRDKKLFSQYSLGMKQRLAIALAVMHNPELLILDEPVNGLDPEGIVKVRALLQKLNQERGITILISSHILGELGKLATRYGVIRDGRMVQEITAQQLEENCRDYLYVRVNRPKEAAVCLEKKLGLTQYEVRPEGRLQIYGGEVSNALTQEGIVIQELYRHRRDTEEYFLEMMGGGENA